MEKNCKKYMKKLESYIIWEKIKKVKSLSGNPVNISKNHPVEKYNLD
jgi:hypothetical protein